MARETNKLTVKEVEAATYTDRAYKMADGGGLTLSVQEQGKYWGSAIASAGKRRPSLLAASPKRRLSAPESCVMKRETCLTLMWTRAPTAER